MQIGTKHDRKLQRYSENFNQIFIFFLQSYRKGILTFCGGNINPIQLDVTEIEGKNVFRKYDNGDYKNTLIKTRHPNIVKGVIIGKKSWGLWLNEWTDGIVEGSFTRHEILEEFTKNGIVIPESLLNDFNNRLYQKRMKRYERL